MIFSKYYIPAHRRVLSPESLLRGGADLVQLDQLPRSGVSSWDAGSRGTVGLGEFLPQHISAMYLRPDLRIVANAGQGNVMKTMSSLAEYLAARHCDDLLLAAIRSDSLLGDFSEIMPTEVVPPHARVQSAWIEIGGGPLATAFAEGARLVIAGEYDAAAPLLGAAVAERLCDWQDHDRLAALAAASHFDGIEVELGVDGSIELAKAASEQLDAVRALGRVPHADVRVDLSQLALESTRHNTLRPTHVTGENSDCQWNARIVVESGFQAIALVAGAADKIGILPAQIPPEFATGSLACTKYLGDLHESGDATVLLRIVYSNRRGDVCHEFVDWIQWEFESGSLHGQIIAPQPVVEQSTEVISVPIPADQVTISVDTRPAREWL